MSLLALLIGNKVLQLYCQSGGSFSSPRFVDNFLLTYIQAQSQLCLCKNRLSLKFWIVYLRYILCFSLFTIRCVWCEKCSQKNILCLRVAFRLVIQIYMALKSLINRHTDFLVSCRIQQCSSFLSTHMNRYVSGSNTRGAYILK